MKNEFKKLGVYTVEELASILNKLVENGYGNKPVYYYNRDVGAVSVKDGKCVLFMGYKHYIQIIG